MQKAAQKPRSLLVRILAMACLLAVLLCTIPSSVQAETLAEKIARLKNELGEISQSIKSYENDITKYEEEKALLEQEQLIIEELLAMLNTNIEETSAAMEGIQGQIADKRASIYENEELLRERMVALYKMNNGGLLSMLFSVRSFSEFSDLVTAMKAISQHDTELLTTLNDDKLALESEYADLDAQLARYNQDMAEKAEYADRLAENIRRQKQNIANAQGEIANQQDAIDSTNAELAAAQKQMDEIAAQVKNQGSQQGDGSSYDGGAFAWPVSGFYYVSCEFGSADPNGDPHRGMDIASGNGSGSIAGARITAAGDGTVIIATYASSYGNYVVVDHGGGLKTVYAHCDSLAVSVGDSVTRGETTLGYVGTTGFSTGYHLHFEVQVNGVRQNPRGYL